MALAFLSQLKKKPLPINLGGTGAYDAAGARTALGVTGARSQTSPANPTGTTSATPTMMGLAGSITPTVSGNVLIIVSGHFNCDGAVNTDGGTAHLRYGTGSAPANAAAVTGTTTGTTASFTVDASTASSIVTGGLIIQSYITGLTVGTTYWLDIDLAATSSISSAVSAHEVVITAIEL